jgi:diaminohydroxyphosphoribosylaminopyrimidine deaminase/5-amino-6-(5-phosphoribosylamino)uracil reductase
MTSDDAIEQDRRHMGRALQLARRGEGHVEPNPMVGCVLVRDGAVVGEGWHQKFGGPHAEIEALAAAGENARGATAYVTLEPCSHTGKTPPCTHALIKASVARVVAACRDPNPYVEGRGLAELEAAGMRCDIGVLADEAADLLAPFTKLVTTGCPWMIAKWAMTLDGKLATSGGDSQWISGELSRARVHELRGRVDAIIVGRGTATHDDPLLTARPPGARTAVRIVLDSHANLSLDSQLVATARQIPVLIAATSETPAQRCRALSERGVEVWQSYEKHPIDQLIALLEELGQRQMTNVLVEGGAKVFGSLLDANCIDEVHAFVAPLLAGGPAPGPIAGRGIDKMDCAIRLRNYAIEQVGADAYIHGRTARRK